MEKATWKSKNIKAEYVFNGLKLVEKGNDTEIYLSNDVSMIITKNRKNNEYIAIANLFSFTNMITIIVGHRSESCLYFLNILIQSYDNKILYLIY